MGMDCEHTEAAVDFEREQREMQEAMPLIYERLKREAEERRGKVGARKAA